MTPVFLTISGRDIRALASVIIAFEPALLRSQSSGRVDGGMGLSKIWGKTSRIFPVDSRSTIVFCRWLFWGFPKFLDATSSRNDKSKQTAIPWTKRLTSICSSTCVAVPRCAGNLSHVDLDCKDAIWWFGRFEEMGHLAVSKRCFFRPTGWIYTSMILWVDEFFELFVSINVKQSNYPNRYWLASFLVQPITAWKMVQFQKQNPAKVRTTWWKVVEIWNLERSVLPMSFFPYDSSRRCDDVSSCVLFLSRKRSRNYCGPGQMPMDGVLKV